MELNNRKWLTLQGQPMVYINYLLVNSDISLISDVLIENTIASTTFTIKEIARDILKI